MLKISRFFSALALAALFSGTGFAQTEQTAPNTPIEEGADNLQIEKIAGQVLGSIDLSKLLDLATKSAEKAAADIAAGKAPSATELENSPAVKEMQTQLQKQMAKAAPELIKAFMPMFSSLLQEFKSELASGLK
jgi:hypothetical protein